MKIHRDAWTCTRHHEHDTPKFSNLARCSDDEQLSLFPFKRCRACNAHANPTQSDVLIVVVPLLVARKLAMAVVATDVADAVRRHQPGLDTLPSRQPVLGEFQELSLELSQEQVLLTTLPRVCWSVCVYVCVCVCVCACVCVSVSV